MKIRISGKPVFILICLSFLLFIAAPFSTQAAIVFPDANGDGTISVSDFTLLIQNYGRTPASINTGDFNQDSKTNTMDFAAWLYTFTHPSPIPSTLPPPPAGSGWMPSAPYYATFFYLWSENPNTDGRWSYWSDGHSPPQNWFSQYLPDPKPNVFDPTTELYSSNNDSIIYWQLSKLAESKIEVAIGSWWGQNHKSDTAFSKIITDVMNRTNNPYPNLRWAIYYEKEGFADVSLSEIVSDLQYIKTNYTNQPGYLKVNGKPVIFVYNAAHNGSIISDYNRWSQARTQTGFYVSLKKDPLSTGAPVNGMDSWHEYAPASRSGSGTDYFFVSPGFWLNGTAPRLGRDSAAFETAVKQMTSSNATWKLVETWNEWGEGSGVEPADEVNQTTGSGTATLKTNGTPFKNLYVDILKRNLPSLERGTGGSGTNPPPPPPPATGTPAVIVAAGDIACGPDSINSQCREWATSELIRQINPQAVLALGDIQYEAGQYAYFTGNNSFCQSNPARCFEGTWGRFKSKIYPAVGNHEYGTANANGYFDYFNGVGIQTSRAGDRSKGYYSFNIGSWHMIALNSNCAKVGGCNAGSAQEQWLRSDLAANTNKCTLAFWHHPLFSSGHHGNEPIRLDYKPLWQALVDHNADLVLVGHSHDYERLAPMDANGNKNITSGIRSFVVGTGGRNFTGWISPINPNSEIRNNTTFGVLKLTLYADRYDWEFVPIAGSTFTDAGTNQLCH